MTNNPPASAFLRQFDAYNAAKCLLQPTDHILCAVSGGVDSMSLLAVLLQKHYTVAVAHCNFALRGAESDGDEGLVRNFSEKNGVQCYVKRFDTADFATQNGLSVQMAARQLRYEWFAELATAQDFTKIAIAHNADDSIETFFVNILRGTGLRGLTGIAPRLDKVVRPLLFAERRQILAFAQQENIPFREDSSNGSLKYVRNRVRHTILPALRGINPAFSATMLHNLEYLAQAADICSECANQLKSMIASCEGEQIRIDASKIPSRHLLYYLHEILGEYGFVGSIVSQIADALQYSGKIFYSPFYVLTCNRGALVLLPRRSNDLQRITYVVEKEAMDIPIVLSATETLVCTVIEPQEADFSLGERYAFLDYQKLRFPLTVRHPQKGDAFIPIGMSGKKKLSDFFTDHKFNTFDKQTQWLLCSGGDIVWIVGRRIHNRYKITPATKKALRVEYQRIMDNGQ